MSGKTTYSEEIALEVCQRVAEGEHLKGICSDPRLPGTTTIYRWMADNDTFRVAFARAREAQMDTFSQEIISIADDASKDFTERIDKNGDVELVEDPQMVQRSKLRIDTRWRLMSTLARAIYGDKVDLKVSGNIEVSGLSDEELEARTRARLVDLGVEVTASMLVMLPGPDQAPASVVTVEPESVETIDPAPAMPRSPGRASRILDG